jgi:chemotaxis protein MotB
MTAKMAFFLVMWLINATDERTKAEIATYFNPIKLPDQNKTEKALQTSDSAGGENKVAVKQRVNDKGEKSKGSGEEEGKTAPKTDEALFADPYGILSKLATQAARTPLPAHAGLRKDGTTQFSGGTAFRDPFDPDFRKRTMRENQDVQTPASARDEIPEASVNESSASPLAQDLAKPDAEPKQAGQGAMPPPSTATPDRPAQEPAKVAGNQPAFGAGESKSQGNAGGPASAGQADQLETAIRQTLREASLADMPDISVTRTGEGLLISLTDNLGFEMFRLASAQPRPELVVAMEKIGQLLKSRSEKVVVRGHTDARPFRSATYDNWRLSSDRANIAHFMLLRGGLPEARLERIEGYADKMPKVPADPKAAANRRIEILLRQPA